MTTRRAQLRILVPFLLSSLAPTAWTQVVNPATAQQPHAPPQDPSIELGQVPTTTVTAQRVSEYREEDLIGPYGQPEWIAHRRFPTTRVYVRPPGTFEFEFWKRPTILRHGPTEIQTQYEFEVGLPGRFQVDMGIVSDQEGNEGPSEFDEQKFEVRWACADWGKIPGNPTLYVELANRDLEADVMEYKLLLGDQLSAGWHWGTDLVFEHEMGGDIANTHEITGGLGKILTDESCSLGGDSPDAQAFFVLGYEF